MPQYDIAIIGAGAAGLMAAIWAGRSAPSAKVLLLDGSTRLGLKILVAGGGRCNVTHHHVDESAYAGSSRNAIKKVLRQFDVPRTIDFFRELGVELKREETGKLFPVTDEARTVLNALVGAVRSAGVELRFPARVDSITRHDTDDSKANSFSICLTNAETLSARRIILATGGLALPKSGSDGHGYTIAAALGHSTTPRTFPGLVPLLLAKDHWLTSLSGVTVDGALEVRSPTGQKLQRFTGSILLTHFGLSGPCVLDVSRFWTAALLASAEPSNPKASGVKLLASWLPDATLESLDKELSQISKQGVLPWLMRRADGKLPERLVSALVVRANIQPGATGATLSRDHRRALATLMTQMELPITGDRGFSFAEVTAGGVPLSELRLETMESRPCPGLHLCGEILDVDGRIGGFNFQWAWASGYVAGKGAAAALAT